MKNILLKCELLKKENKELKNKIISLDGQLQDAQKTITKLKQALDKFETKECDG